MDACCAIFNPYTNNFNDPVKPSFKPLLHFHGRIVSTFSALPQNRYVWEIIQRICRIIVAPLMYLTLVLYAVAGSCAVQPVAPKLSLMEDVFQMDRNAFVNLALIPLINSNHIKRISLNVHVSHKERGEILNKVVFFNSTDFEWMFGRVGDDSLSYEHHQKSLELVRERIMEKVMEIEIPGNIKNMYRKLPDDEFDKITYSYSAIGLDTSGVFHENTMYDDRSVECTAQDKWKKSTFTDPAKMAQEIRACFDDETLVQAKNNFIEQLKIHLSTVTAEKLYLRITINGNGKNTSYDHPIEVLSDSIEHEVDAFLSRQDLRTRIAGMMSIQVHVYMMAIGSTKQEGGLRYFRTRCAASIAGLSEGTANFAILPKIDDKIDQFFAETK